MAEEATHRRARANQSSSTGDDNEIIEHQDHQDANLELRNRSIGKAKVDEESEIWKSWGTDSKVSLRSPTCPECGKTFSSCKSMYGHLRSHPYRSYKGATPPSPLNSKNNQRSDAEIELPAAMKWTVTARRGRGELVPAIEAEDYEISAAKNLMLMACDWASEALLGYTDDIDAETDRKETSFDQLVEPELVHESSAPSGGRKYRCNTCKKTFSSHQASGGHRASHNMQQNNTEEEQLEGEHENDTEKMLNSDDEIADAAERHPCDECDSVFFSGQALGGHKRRHYNEKKRAAAAAAAAESSLNSAIMKSLNSTLMRRQNLK